MSDVIEFITNNKLGKYRLTGDQVELGCPNKKCANQGQPQFYINKNTGAYFCHRCDWKGTNLKSLQFKMGLIEIQEPIENSHIFFSPKEIEEMQDALWQQEDAISYLIDTRGFTEETIEHFRFGWKKFDGNPAIILPYFDTAEICVGIKYYFYTKPAGVSKMRFEKDSKIQAYNLHGVDLTKDLIVTEGEFDAVTAWQLGYKNVVSIPNGANGINEWVEEIEGCPKYLICFDNDKAGKEGAKRFADKVGASKCYRVYPCLKDLNEMLQCGLAKEDFDKVFKDPKPMFVAPITDITQYIDSTLEIIKRPQVNKGVSTGWKSVDYYLGGIREGEVTVTSGITGHGKTTFALALIANLIQQNIPCLIISPEMPENDLLLNLTRNHFKKQVDIKDEKAVLQFMATLKNKVHIAHVYNEWTTKKEDRTIDRVFDLIDHSVRHKGVKFVLIDHLRFFITPKEQESERFCIDQFMQKCVNTAIQSKAHIWLVVQPKNLPANQKKITLMDLKGSSNIGQDAHNVVLVHRYDDPKKEKWVEVSVVKNRKFGLCGTVPLEFNLNSMANYMEVRE